MRGLGEPVGTGSLKRFDQYTFIPTADAPGTSCGDPATKRTRDATFSPSAASTLRLGGARRVMSGREVRLQLQFPFEAALAFLAQAQEL